MTNESLAGDDLWLKYRLSGASLSYRESFVIRLIGFNKR